MINEPQLPVLAKGRGALSSAIFLPGSGCHFAGIVVARWQEGSRCQENCGIHNGTNNHLPNGLLKDSSTFGPKRMYFRSTRVRLTYIYGR